MKHVKKLMKELKEVYFLTHTVQMKLCKRRYVYENFIYLLNPHGSDETIKKESFT